MPPAPLLLLQNIRLTFGGAPVLQGATLSVGAGERLALIGRNGSGKSSLLKIAAGLLEADGGSRFVQPGTTVRYLPQEPELSGYATPLDYVEGGLAPGDDPYRARLLLEKLGLRGDEDARTLSGGEARRAALARVLAPSPDILLLDEPTNHLDLPAIAWLEAELADSRSALVLISHDRRFLESLSRAMVWLDRGAARRLERGFAEFEAWRDEVLAQEEADAHKLGRKIVREESWLRYGVTARRKRNVRRLGELHALRQQRRAWVGAPGRVKMAAAEGETSGVLVIAAERVSKSWSGAAIVSDFSTRILRGDRVGIIGPNGAGKTTLLRLLTGALPPDAGRVTLGTGLVTVTLDQRRAVLDPAATLAETLTGGRGDTVFVGDEARHVHGYMKDFLFAPEQARTPVSALSGGERGRLVLARALATPANLLVLDEPTNDLDLETLDLLQELLAEHPGTVLLVSHDRDFLDRVSTSVIVSEGDGRWQEYAGGYTDMLAQRGRAIEGRNLPSVDPVPQPVEAIVAAPTPGQSPRRRLSFKQQQALRTLPDRIEALHATLAALHKALSDPALYARDRTEFARRSAELAAAESDLRVAEEEWLALEILREEIERP
ncbi:MAG: ATP-binding cassette domain-containing protein [Rhodospirillales bacterium]|nr:ATP-binding cassette domain-containing protein [Rhodospirillales bacterium]